MSDSLVNLPKSPEAPAPEELARIRPYMKDAPARAPTPFIVLVVIAALLALPFWNGLSRIINPYIIMAIKVALFIGAVILYRTIKNE